MENTRTIMKWSELRGLPVKVPSQGKTIGVIEDFYFKPGTNSIDALCVRTRINGDLTLPATSITTVLPDGVTIANEHMLTVRKPPFPLGSSLLTAQVKSEKGKMLGSITDVLLGVVPPVALRVAGYEMADSLVKKSHNTKRFDADSVVGFEQNVFIVQNQAARWL